MPLTLSELDNISAMRQVTRNTFGTNDGQEVLTWILNECGVYAQEESKVKPELVALANRLLGIMGIVRADNLFEITRNLIGAANDEDLTVERIANARRKEEAGDGSPRI